MARGHPRHPERRRTQSLGSDQRPGNRLLAKYAESHGRLFTCEYGWARAHLKAAYPSYAKHAAKGRRAGGPNLADLSRFIASGQPDLAEREIYYSRASAAIHGSPRSLGTFDQTLGCPPTTRWRGAATLAVTVWRVRSRCQSARDCRHRPTTHRGELGRAGPDRPPSQPALPGPPACGVPVRARRHEGCARGASHPSKMAYPPPACASASRARWRCSSACAASNTVHRPDEPLRSLRELIAGLIPGHSARQMTYDLRRLAARGSSSGSRAPSDTS